MVVTPFQTPDVLPLGELDQDLTLEGLTRHESILGQCGPVQYEQVRLNLLTAFLETCFIVGFDLEDPFGADIGDVRAHVTFALGEEWPIAEALFLKDAFDVVVVVINNVRRVSRAVDIRDKPVRGVAEEEFPGELGVRLPAGHLVALEGLGGEVVADRWAAASDRAAR